MTDHGRVARASKLKWVRLGDMIVSPKAQREFRKAHGDDLAAGFSIEAMGYPVVSHRDDHYWLLDGQHRVYALKANGFTDDDHIECEVYEGLTEAEEADLFLLRDERRRVGNFDRFRIAVVAGRQKECHIQRVVEKEGYKISQSGNTGCIAAVDALRFVYAFSSQTLARTVRILGGAFDGDKSGFDAHLLRGMGLVCQRYDGSLDDETLTQRLAGITTPSLIRKANALQLRTGHRKQDCVAAAIVETYNAGRGGKKLESWWR